MNMVPPDKHQDLIFVQNGMLYPWLLQRGLEKNTQVLLYMSGEQQTRLLVQVAALHVKSES